MFSEDRIVIQYLCQNQNYNAKRVLTEFPDKGWKLADIGVWQILIKLIRECVELTESNKHQSVSCVHVLRRVGQQKEDILTTNYN